MIRADFGLLLFYLRMVIILNISDEILKAIEIMIDSKLKKLDFDRTYTGIISSVNKDGYTVKYSGTEINIKTTATDVFKKGDMVKFCVPCGNKMKAYFVVDLGLMKKLMN